MLAFITILFAVFGILILISAFPWMIPIIIIIWLIGKAVNLASDRHTEEIYKKEREEKDQ